MNMLLRTCIAYLLNMQGVPLVLDSLLLLKTNLQTVGYSIPSQIWSNKNIVSSEVQDAQIRAGLKQVLNTCGMGIFLSSLSL